MIIPGQRVRRTRIVRTDRFVVVLDVEAVIPDADTSEPCFEPDVVKLMRDVEDHAKAGDVDWLRRHTKAVRGH